MEPNLGQGAMQKAGWAKSDTVLCPCHRLGTTLPKLGEMKTATQSGERWQKGFNASVDQLCEGEQGQFPVAVLLNALAERKDQPWPHRLTPDPSNSHQQLLKPSPGPFFIAFPEERN